MKVVVIGDIGWRDLYHLGDEAMTEAAIDMLRSRGIEDITLVAGEPDAAEEFYGLRSVTRLGFRAEWTRDQNDAHLSAIVDQLDSDDFDERSTYAAIRDCDAVIIAGGGNMNSRDYHLLYERLGSARIAAHFGRPLYVTSQTVGPILDDADRDRVVEIADIARAFGCREAATAALLRKHVARPESIHATLDDAAVLSADDTSREAARTIAGDAPYAVASFTWHAGNTWGSLTRYYRDVANICRSLAERHHIDVLLVPHAGSLKPNDDSRDLASNAEIARLAATPKVRATRMVTAREDVALLESAVVSLSTRYHPTVFAPAVATPAIAISPSLYSSIRMRGSLRHVGLERFVITTSSLHLLDDALVEAVKRDDGLDAHLDSARDHAANAQSAWWDALVESMRSDAAVSFVEHADHPTYVPEGDWSRSNEIITPVYEQLAGTADRLIQARARIKNLEADLERANARVSRYRDRKVIRLLDRGRQR